MRAHERTTHDSEQIEQVLLTKFGFFAELKFNFRKDSTEAIKWARNGRKAKQETEATRSQLMFVFGKNKHQSFYNLQGKCTAFFGDGLLMGV